MPHMPQMPLMPQDSLEISADVQIVPLYPDVQIIPIKQSEPAFPSESVSVLIIELGRTTNASLNIPKGAEWIVEQAVGQAQISHPSPADSEYEYKLYDDEDEDDYEYEEEDDEYEDDEGDEYEEEDEDEGDAGDAEDEEEVEVEEADQDIYARAYSSNNGQIEPALEQQ